MKERSIDEFESIFERASIPVLDIKNIALKRVSAILKGEPLDDAVLLIAAYLKKRFTAEIDVHFPAARDGEMVTKAAAAHGLEPHTYPFVSTAELVGQVSIGRRQLLLMAEPVDEGARVLDIDALVEGTAPPVLIVRQMIDKPAGVFANILHSLTGRFQQTQNFAYSFTLAERNARLELLHTVDQSEVEDVRDALQVSPDISEQTGKELLECMALRAERYLKAVVAASDDRPFDVTYGLALGEVVPTIRAALAGGEYTLLVVGSHVEGHSQVSAGDYQLMHVVREIPVLAL